MTGWFLLVTFSLVVTLGHADTGESDYGPARSLSKAATEITAPEDFHYSNHLLIKVRFADWMAAEVVHDLPDMVLRNSLGIWTTDYLRNPFYRITNINAP